MAEERWLPVAGFEGLYEVSDQGRVKSLKRLVKRKTKGDYIVKERILKPFTRGDGYVFVPLSKNGTRCTKSVHRLVAEAFIPNPDNLPEVNHKDENKSNNELGNLEWCDQEYNSNYGTSKVRLGDKVAKKVSAIDVHGRVVATFRSQSDAERMTGISQSSISACINSVQSTAGGYSWKSA